MHAYNIYIYAEAIMVNLVDGYVLLNMGCKGLLAANI